MISINDLERASPNQDNQPVSCKRLESIIIVNRKL
jgi:hypothetical protein